MNCFFFQAEDGIRDAQESRGLGDVYKRQTSSTTNPEYQPMTNTSRKILLTMTKENGTHQPKEIKT